MILGFTFADCRLKSHPMINLTSNPDALLFLDRGGVLMYVLLALSIYGLGLTLAKWMQFVRAGLYRRRFEQQLGDFLSVGDRTAATELSARMESPLGRVVFAAFQHAEDKDQTDEEVRTKVFQIGQGELRSLSRYVSALSVISTVAPLVGLLGTVMGMIRAFAKLQSAGAQVNPALLAGGIWEALLTTAAGLAIAIIATVVVSYCDAVIDRCRAQLSDYVAMTLMLCGRRLSNETLSLGEDRHAV